MNDAYRQGYDRIIWKPAPPEEPKPRIAPARGAFSCPMVISDTMDPTEHIDGRFYDSKTKFRAVTKAHGCVEIGNDPARLRKPAKPKADPVKRREAIQKAIAQTGL